MNAPEFVNAARVHTEYAAPAARIVCSLASVVA
jgi:hypothetical protein